MMNQEAKSKELDELRTRVAALETDLAEAAAAIPGWPPKGYYTTYHILAGAVLGLMSASASLLFNIIGGAMVLGDPLRLIKVYLTFPMGESALTSPTGFALAAGCCLYLGTGMIGGIPFHMILSRFLAEANLGKRFIVATILGVGIWLINFYGVLYWLQPLLIDGGRWIVEQIPWYVAAATHLVFAWTMLLVDQWGRFTPYRTAKQEPAR